MIADFSECGYENGRINDDCQSSYTPRACLIDSTIISEVTLELLFLSLSRARWMIFRLCSSFSCFVFFRLLSHPFEFAA